MSLPDCDIRELDEFILEVDLPDGWGGWTTALAAPIFLRRLSSPFCFCIIRVRGVTIFAIINLLFTTRKGVG